MKTIFQNMLDCLLNGENVVLVTIIAGSGSTPRGSGARMLVRENGEITGTIGGGAVEYKAQKLAAETFKKEKSFIKGFELSPNEVVDLGMICGGRVVVYFQFITPGDEDIIEFCRSAVSQFSKDEDSWLIMDITYETAWNMGIYTRSGRVTGMEVPDSSMLIKEKTAQIEVWDRKYYSEPLVKAGTVYVFGGGHVGQELVPLLTHVGFRCVVLDDRPAFTEHMLFPEAEEVMLCDFSNISETVAITEHDYVVIMTRGHQHDFEVQAYALKTKACYIGVMGSRTKMKTIAGKLMDLGFTKTDISRFYTPIGLDILAETPAEIAVSIAGELIRVRAGRLKGE